MEERQRQNHLAASVRASLSGPAGRLHPYQSARRAVHNGLWLGYQSMRRFYARKMAQAFDWDRAWPTCAAPIPAGPTHHQGTDVCQSRRS